MAIPQAPIGSGFGAASTIAEVIAGRDVTGKLFLSVVAILASESRPCARFVPAAQGLLCQRGRGYESQFSANHLGPFQLSCRLRPALVTAEGACVVALSAYAHRQAGVGFHDPNFERREYDPWLAYG